MYEWRIKNKSHQEIFLNQKRSTEKKRKSYFLLIEKKGDKGA